MENKRREDVLWYGWGGRNARAINLRDDGANR